MRRLPLLFLALAIVSGCDTASVPDEPVELAFSKMDVASDLFFAPSGGYVFRDSTSWNETVKKWWDLMYTCDENGCHEIPPPRYNFDDSLMMVVAHGTIACSHSGGSVKRIVADDDAVHVELEPLTELDPACLAAVPLNHFVRVAQKDIPRDFPVEFGRDEP